MNQEFLVPVLPPDAVAKLKTRSKQLSEVHLHLAMLRNLVEQMHDKDDRDVTVADVALAVDLHRDVSQMLEAVRELTQEPTK